MRTFLTFLILAFLSHFAIADEPPPEEELILSTPEQLAALSNNSSFLIKRLVSPISGTFALRKTDLIVRGAQNIVLERIYIPPYIPSSFHDKKKNKEDWDKYFLYHYLFHNDNGWQFFPHLRLQVHSKNKIVRVADPNGMTLEFKVTGSATTLISDPYGINNAAGDIPSGKYDPRNTKVLFQNNKVIVHSPDGSTRIYRLMVDLSYFIETNFYYLEKEILPNGKILKYHNMGNSLRLIESLSPDEQYVYANLKIESGPLSGKCQFTSSSGDIVTYNYEKRPIKVKIEENHHTQEIDNFFPPILKTVSSPFYRNEFLQYSDIFLLNHYNGKSEFFTCDYGVFGNSDSKHFKLTKLFFPVGINDSFLPVCEMNYDPPIAGEKEGTTTVKNADGTKIVYQFSKQLLTKTIETYDQNDVLKLQKRYCWTENQWLKSLELLDGEGLLFYKKTYEYDTFGNPTSEIFTGDLTGKEKIETYVIKREYSQDGRHLLLREENEDGKVLNFEYLPNTNLITAKFTQDKNQILIREFFIYDSCHNIIQKIIDDGKTKDQNDLNEVTERTVIKITLRQQAPFIHMPELIEEKYFENGKETLFKKTHLIYDTWGNICQEDVYDSEGNFAYSIYKTYNERGDLLSETNPLGQKATYAYDEKGHCIQATNFSGRLRKQNLYDLRGRVTSEKKLGIDNFLQEFSYRYDLNDDLIHKTDEYENITYYQNDPITHKSTKIHFPEIIGADGKATSISTHSTHDALGRETSKTDANGNTTFYKYNAYGSISEIIHPNDSKESFIYDKNGKLKNHTNQEGLIIDYEYDILGRILAKKYYAGEKIAEEIITYNSFHLLSETNKEGNTTKYTYDGLGRKIREDFCGRVIEYQYDSLGRLVRICKYNDVNTLFIHYERDLLDRVICEKKTDTQGNLLFQISFAYDEDGNKKEITRYISNNPSTECFFYDCFGRITKYQDALGNETKMLYDQKHLNAIGQKVLRKTILDPKHISTIKTYDSFGRVVKNETLNPEQKILVSKENYFDPCGNLVAQQDHIYKGIQYQNTQVIRYTYTNQNFLETTTRAFGTADERTTHYAYTPSGKIATKTLPNATILSYSYSPLGYLIALKSSDGTVDHQFERNLLGQIQCASNEPEKIRIDREIDPFDNILSETFSSELSIKKTYDAFSRPLSIKFRNHGEVNYNYDPVHLKSVSRFSPSGVFLYSHHYENYDLDGNLLLEELIGNSGKLQHQIDQKGRKIGLESPYFTQFNTYDVCDNLISSIEDHQRSGYAYDGLNQLIAEKSPDHNIEYFYDSHHNRLGKNKEIAEINELDELRSLGEVVCEYDVNGNLITKKTPRETWHFTYDALNQLKEATSENKKIHFTYDPLGRRFSKVVQESGWFGWSETTREYYLWDSQNEVGAFTSGAVAKNIKILGNAGTPIAIELNGTAYAPIHDVQGNVRHLVDLSSKVNSYSYTAFGQQLKNAQEYYFNPWRYVGKRWDEELGLYYFGKRYYDPQLARWLTTDPAGFVDGTNLYQYVLNNPFSYYDQFGESAGTISLSLLEIGLGTAGAVITSPIWGAAALVTGAAILGVWTGHAIYQYYEQHGNFPISLPNISVNNVWDVPRYFPKDAYISLMQRKKKGEIDENLSKDPFNDPNLEDISHPEAREQGRHKFRDKRTGEIIEYDKAQPGETGHKGHDHYHRPNPNATGKEDYYLDSNGNPVPKGSETSHLYLPEWVWWK